MLLSTQHIPDFLPWLALAIPALFMFSFLVLGVFGKRWGSGSDLFALGIMGTGLLLAIAVFVISWGYMPNEGVSLDLGYWLSLTPGRGVKFLVQVDNITVLMLLLVSGITFLVHIFSVEYMRGDPYKPRYWTFLALFSFSMTSLVLMDNLIMIFVFWELVGVSSYFLVGFWFKKEIPARASQKAFIVNRIGDFGFMAGIMILFFLFDGQLNLHTAPYDGMNLESLNGEPYAWLGLAGLFFFIGAAGKSAQFPLQVWLPDAMAGPTPVSSLIHAATMVAAGIYLLIRLSLIFTIPVMVLIAILGALTALMAAISALKQTDIKRILAYSTISQLGFMVMGVGVGAAEWSFFHLLTHAFFKCGLFLSAGLVIHQLHKAVHKYQEAGGKGDFDVQHIGFMGGLRSYFPKSTWLYLIFAASLAGLPIFSGFISKDGILLGAFDWAQELGGMAYLVPLTGVIAAFLTAFYITRHAMLIYFGENRLEKFRPELSGIKAHIQEGNPWFLIPLLILAILSLGFAFAPLQPWNGEAAWLMDAHLVGKKVSIMGVESHGGNLHALLPWIMAGIAGLGIALGWMRFRNGIQKLEDPENMGLTGRIAFHHFYLDAFYQKALVNPFLKFTRFAANFDKKIFDGAVNGIASLVVRKDEGASLSKGSNWLERNVIDRFVNGVASWVSRAGSGVRKVQTGRLQTYIIFTLLGLLVLLLILFYFGT